MENPSNALINERHLSKLKWRCRRGLLENDLFLERFFKRYERQLTLGQALALNDLMDLGDNDLLDLHLGRKTALQVSPELSRPDIAEVLTMLRTPPTTGG